MLRKKVKDGSKTLDAADLSPATLEAMKSGSDMIRLLVKNKPQERRYIFNADTWRLSCYARGRSLPESSINILQMREVRKGPNVRDLKQWADEWKDKEKCCFTVLHGDEFRLKAENIIAPSEVECNLWVEGLRWAIARKPTPRMLNNQWLISQFISLDKNATNKLSLKEMSAFVQTIGLKMKKQELKDAVAKVETNGWVDFNAFRSFYLSLFQIPEFIKALFNKYSDGLIRMNVKRFQKFLLEHQKDTRAKDTAYTRQLMAHFSDTPPPDYELSDSEFFQFLFSSANPVYDHAADEFTHDMSKPLTHYWIASSHNTYLMGDQFSSESSCEAYVRALRMGCRCIELDCWDSPDGDPIIYHGHTLTSKIKFRDVVAAINEHAFVASPYPLILSIENHCSIEQQKIMAKVFRDTFAEKLLTSPLSKALPKDLPSPERLKNKILIKNKKLKEGMNEMDAVATGTSTGGDTEEGTSDTDISSSLINGNLYLFDSFDKQWEYFYFVLAKSKKCFYGELAEADQGDVAEEEEEDAERDENYELHFAETWFHGKLPGGRTTAERLMKACDGPDGAFLVRESDRYEGSYTLSFWYQGGPHHVLIARRDDGRYGMANAEETFPNLYEMIEYYKRTPIKSKTDKSFKLQLDKYVPQLFNHEKFDWFHKGVSRATAEKYLLAARKDGTFLVRASESDPNAFAISFLAEGKLKHCRLKVEGRLYVIGSMQFESIEAIIKYFSKNALFRKVKLRTPLTPKLMERLGISSETPAPSRNRSETGSSSGLKNSTPSNPQMKDVDEEKPDVVVVRTLARYAAARPDELSFGKNEIIKRVEKYDGGWWKHTTPQGEAKWLPANFVEELEFSARKTDDDVEDDNPLGALLKGHFSIEGAELSPITMMEEYHCFTITPDTLNMTFTVGSMVEKDVKDWHEVIMGSLQEKTLTADGLDTEALKAKKKEKKGKKGIAKELSDIVVYTRSVPFESFEHSIKNYECYEMSSFPESKAEKLCRRQPSEFTKYTRRQFARVYPNGKRVDSSNFEPELMWNCGLQMVALNYQTPDRPMQVNNGLFRQNGACGYLLKPKFLTDGSGFNPFDPTTFGSIMRKQITIEICCAKHLHKSGKGIPSPFVEVEMIGAYCDSGVKYKTKTKSVQGFNPVWMETFVFDVTMPALAMLRFAVMDEDMFGDPNFVGQSCVPIQQLQNGTRSVQLLNGYSEPIGMSYLLINVTTVEHEESDQDKAIRTLTQQSRQLSDEIEKLMAEQIGIADKNSAKSKELEKRIEEMQGQVSQNEKECTQLIKSSSDQMKLQQSKRRKGSKK